MRYPLHEWRVERQWNGAPGDWQADVALSLQGVELTVDIKARYWGDPPPARPSGRCPRLWEHEVVELFIAGVGRGKKGRRRQIEAYLELEIGPHGHWLALELEGRRNVVHTPTIQCEVTLSEGIWHASARFNRSLLPDGPLTANAYSIHGVGEDRRYHAAFAVPGERPDFHRLECFEGLHI